MHKNKPTSLDQASCPLILKSWKQGTDCWSVCCLESLQFTTTTYSALSHFIPSLLLAKDTHKLRYELELGQSWCFTFTEMQNYYFCLFRVHSLGNVSFIQESVAEQYKGRRGVLPLLRAAHYQAEEPRNKGEKTNRAPFPRAIKQSVIKSDRQRSTGSKAPPAWPWRWMGEGENRPCLQQGAAKPGCLPREPQGWENWCNSECLIAGSREDWWERIRAAL